MRASAQLAATPRLHVRELDAARSSGDGGAGARLWEALPHFTALDYASPLSLAFCGAAALQALPGPAREAVAQAARETETRQFAAISTRLAENEARMRANGVLVASAPAELRAALARASEPVVAEWVARAGAEGGGHPRRLPHALLRGPSLTCHSSCRSKA